MNKQAYRVIFSQVAGTFIAVAENVSSQGKAKSKSINTQSVSTSKNTSLRFATVSVLVAALFGSVTMAHAQMVAYKNGAGPRPTIDQSASGRPVVQIVKPNETGLSHNRYDQFNVDKNGAILNNSSTITRTQLGGYIDGNPNIAPGAGAKIILNEVMSTNRSQLNGYIEVAGQRADVIIANPNGIFVGGLGFINASRAVLTTGSPTFGRDGSLAAFRVTQGDINVGVGGLNGTGASALDLIARSVSVNDKIFADKLNAVVGANQVNYGDLGVLMIAGVGGQPTVGIDSSVLGGMYAQKIMLAGNEYGVGVRLLGDVAASAGDVTISNAGQITLNNKTNATGRLAIQSGDAVTNAGVLYAQQVAMTSAARVTNTGTIAAQNNLNINSAAINSTGVLAAGIDANGQATQAGNLSLSASGMLTATGQNLAGGNVAMRGSSIDLTHATTSSTGSTTLTATAGNIDHSDGNLQVAGSISIDATNAIINDGGVMNTAQFTSNSGALSNVAGRITQSGAADTSITTAGTTNNTSGTIATNATNLNLQAGNLQNKSGSITQAGTGTLNINTNEFDNTAGNMATNGQLLITAAELQNQAGNIITNRNAVFNLSGDLQNNHGTIQTANQLQVNAVSIDNSAGRLISLDTSGLSLETSGLLTNTAGTTAGDTAGGIIGGNGDVDIVAANVTNSGNITAGQNLSANISTQLNNDGGRIAASKTLNVQAAALSNSQGVLDAARIRANIAQLNNNNGKISADQLTIHATNLSNQHGQLAQFGTDASVIEVSDLLDNSNGVIQTNSADLTLTPQQLINTSGQISHAGTGQLNIDVGVGTIHNQHGNIGSNGTASISAASINNQSGSLFAQGEVTVNATAGDIDNSNGGHLSGDSLALNAIGNINNTQGKIEALNNGLAINANSLNNAAGSIQQIGTSAFNIALQQRLNNGTGFIGSAGELNINASDIDNTAGTLYAKENVTLNASGVLTNASGVIQSDGSINATATAAVNNRSGRIEANGANATLNVAGASIDNTLGRVANSGTGSTTIDSGSMIINDNGVIGGNGDVTLTASTLNNTQQGQVIAAGDLNLQLAVNLNNNQGSLYAAKNLTLQQRNATVSNQQGSVEAAGKITLDVASLDNTLGHIISSTAIGANGTDNNEAGDIALTVAQEINNAGGTIGSSQHLQLQAQKLVGDGRVTAGQDAIVQLQGDHTFTANNIIRANRDFSFTTTGTLTNTSNLEAVRHLILNAGNITNLYGALINAGNGTTFLKVANSVYNLGRIYGDDIAIEANSITNDGVLDANGNTLQAGIIAARNDVDLGASTIINREHAVIQSLRNMSIGGALDANHRATGKATYLQNASATIDAGANLDLQVAQLDNLNLHFATQMQRDDSLTKVVTYFMIDGSPVKYYYGVDADTVRREKVEKLRIFANGSEHNGYTVVQYKETTDRDVVVQSDAGKITAGGNIALTGKILNDKSTIMAGGSVIGAVDTIDNRDAIGAVIVHQGDDELDGRGDPVSFIVHHGIKDGDCNLIGRNCDDVDDYSRKVKHEVTLPTQTVGLKIVQQIENQNLDHRSNDAIGVGVDHSDAPTGHGSTIGSNESGQKLSGDAQRVDGATGAGGGNATTDGSSQTVGSIANPIPNLVLPNSQLFPITTDPTARYVIETDPKFTNYKNFLSSDYMLSRLSVDPQHAQKRLGDGFYEQKLINDQIAQLTGKRFLGDYTTNEQQYQALMESGVKSAEQFQLTPGIALSATQMAALTSDMVWLVSQEVVMPDGNKTKVLVPVVYLARLDSTQVQATGSIISGRNMDLAVNGSVQNGGTMQATNNALIHATDIINTGALRADAAKGSMVLIADNDIINTGGNIAGKNVGLLAGRDVIMSSTVSDNKTSSGNAEHGLSSERAIINNVASIKADQLSIQGGRDISLTATKVDTTGDTNLIAGRDINLGTVTTKEALSANYDTRNNLSYSQTKENGTQITTGGNLVMSAAQDINAKAAYANATGEITVAAGRDINLTSAQQQSSYAQETYVETSGLFSSSSTHTKENQQGTQSIGTTLSGDKVQVAAGRDVNVTGSNVIGTNDVNVVAGNNINITTSQNTAHQSYSKEETTSGLFSSGGFGITLGSKEEGNTAVTKQVINNASTIGSTDGNVTLVAGNGYTQSGSNIIALGGDSTIAAKTIDITAVQDSYTQTNTTHTEQSGLTLAVSAPIIAAVQTVRQMATATSQTDDARMKLLGTAVAANAVVQGAAAAQNPTQGVTVSLTIGGSQSDSQTEQINRIAQGSNITAGGNVNLVATGAGKDSHINVIGSNINAGNNAVLISDGKTNLEAAQNSSSQHSTSSSSSAAIGVAATYGPDGMALGITANASGSRGNADGEDTSYTNTHVNAGKQLVIISGGDTTLKGAVVTAKQVIGQIGGNLNMESLQDTSNYASKDQNIGGSVTVGYGFSGSVNVGQTKVKGDYQSVGEQTGIAAGDGGFQLNVKGNTDLKGAVIASTQDAIDQNRNSFTTGTLTQSELQNHSNYEASSISIGMSGGQSDSNKDRPAQTGPVQVATFNDGNSGVAAGFSSKDGNSQSTTKSGISGNTNGGGIIITDDLKQQSLTGKTAAETVASINKDITTGTDTTSLAKDWDAQKLKDQVNAGAKITAAFSQQAGQAVSDYAKKQRGTLQEQLKNASTPEEQQALQKQINEVNTQERVMNVLIGAVTGSGGVALTRETLGAAADVMRQMTAEDSRKFPGITDGTTTLTNNSGTSEGVRGSNDKQGGTRVDLDGICGKVNERCVVQKNPDGTKILGENGIPKLELNAQEQVQFEARDEKGNLIPLADFMKSPEGQKTSGLTGGIQGMEGTLFGRPYKPGGWEDKGIEAFAGSHDSIGGKLSGLYDELGNIKRGMSPGEKFLYDRWSEIAIPIAAPFGMAEGLPPEVWNAISVLLKAAK